jgi:pyruvate,water dikinase
MPEQRHYVLDFSAIGWQDGGRVGGKNASLGELFRALRPKGVRVLDGFATTADAYWRLLATNGLQNRLRSIFDAFDAEDLRQLAERGEAARASVLATPLPEDIRTATLSAYDRLSSRIDREPELAVRSSATAEDLPEASFAGAAETFLTSADERSCWMRSMRVMRRSSRIVRSAIGRGSDTTS